MKGYEIMKEIRTRRGSNDIFIKWWRRENDFLDFDTIDRFVTNFKDSEVIYDFALLGIDQMWGEVKRICGDRISKVDKADGAVLVWEPAQGSKAGQKLECPFTPESLVKIMDTETKGNPVDS